MDIFAHVNPVDHSLQSLAEHQRETARHASEFASQFGCSSYGSLLGNIHDVGKANLQWQHYLFVTSGYDTSIPRNQCEKGHHSSAGAQYLLKQYPQKFPLNLLLAYIVAGHHAGLPDYNEGNGVSLASILYKDGNVLKNDELEKLENWENDECQLKFPVEMPKISSPKYVHVWVRMLYSCLVDADWLDTERFMEPKNHEMRGGAASLKELKARFDDFIARMRLNSSDTMINRKRNAIFDSCVERAFDKPGFYSLTVPTGGGKTFSAMAFALTHAVRYCKNRIIMTAPFTTITQQTARIYKYGSDDPNRIEENIRNGTTLFGDENVLEHHSRVAPEQETWRSRLAAQNWDAPIIVTTAVQLLESLHAAKSSSCRKLHNIANSVIIFDEAQKIPADFLAPVINTLKALVSDFGVTVLFCTATQPDFRGRIGSSQSHFDGIEHCEEIIKDASALLNEFKRTTYEIYKGSLDYKASWLEIADELCKARQVLCIVNKRRDCRELCRLMPKGTIELSGLMCGEEIADTVAKIKESLKMGKDIRVVSTQLVEAGVDLDFPEVWRALAGLDSIAQAGGRCNREGRLKSGRVVIFNPDSAIPMGDIKNGAQRTETMLCKHDINQMTPEMFHEYFSQFYGNKKTLDKSSYYKYLVSDVDRARLQFRTYADAFKLIDDSNQVTVFVPYESDLARKKRAKSASELIEELQTCGISKIVMYRLQNYTFTIPMMQFTSIVKRGGVYEPFPGLYALHECFYQRGKGVLTESDDLYDSKNFIY